MCRPPTPFLPPQALLELERLDCAALPMLQALASALGGPRGPAAWPPSEAGRGRRPAATAQDPRPAGLDASTEMAAAGAHGGGGIGPLAAGAELGWGPGLQAMRSNLHHNRVMWRLAAGRCC